MSARPEGVRSALVVFAVLGAALVTAHATASATAPGAATFTFVGHEQHYIVPTGVTDVRIVAIGAAGQDVSGGIGAAGGLGGVAAGDLPVTAGDELYVEVGGSGATSWNGGGVGAGGGGDGGDASDVRTSSSTGTGSLPSRVVVAAGGGGAGAADGESGEAGGNAGANGDPAGTDCGIGGDSDDLNAGCPGERGTTTTGGAGGFGTAQSGTAGELGVGGTGGAQMFDGGGGGGGGLYGGGGGGVDPDNVSGGTGGGGGGGASGFASRATNTSVAIDHSGVPRVTISPLYRFSVSKTGRGAGTITGGGLNCGKVCANSYPASTSILLTAKAAVGSRFTGWSGGGCTGKKGCSVTTPSAAVVVKANFVKAPPNTSITEIDVQSTKAVFRFRATGASTGFKCALTRRPAKTKFTKCHSPKRYGGLKAGHYTFSVEAVGPGGRDTTPATKRFTVKRH